jgi:16S rRNA (adenine1518-N6/adenine1519-N6)-dimethyltransferase
MGVPRLGQHFLRRNDVLRREAKYGDVKGKEVIEIGAGDGRLTAVLLEEGAKKVIAIEKDRLLAEKLKKRFAGERRVKVLLKDFLKYEGKGSDVIMGNIPYYISSPIIFKLKDMEFETAVLCLQREFGERMVAAPGKREYGRLSVTSQLYFESELLEVVPPEAFSPVPKVESAIMRLRKKKVVEDRFLEEFIRYLFQHKKKSVRNALLDSRDLFGEERKELRREIERIKNKERKVFTLTIDEIREFAGEVRKLVKRAEGRKE